MAVEVKLVDALALASVKNFDALATASVSKFNGMIVTAPATFPQSSDLAYYWKLDETSGTSVADSKGSNTGTLTGGTVNQS